MLAKLPEVLEKHLDFQDAYQPPIGFSPEEMLLLPGGYDGKPAVLKYSGRKEVFEEGQIYRWLKGKLPVPEVYFNAQVNDIYYLVVSLEKGDMLSTVALNLVKEDCLKSYGKLLRQIHEVEIKDFPFVHDRTYKLAKAAEVVQRHEAKTEYFERELKTWTPKKMLTYLKVHQDFEEDLVFCHGDVCFPNFLVDENGGLLSVLDVSGAGINDRHLDLAIGLRTLRYNFELKGWQLTNADIALFLEAYGIETIDKEKITFYILLDELTNG